MECVFRLRIVCIGEKGVHKLQRSEVRNTIGQILEDGIGMVGAVHSQPKISECIIGKSFVECDLRVPYRMKADVWAALTLTHAANDHQIVVHVLHVTESAAPGTKSNAELLDQDIVQLPSDSSGEE